MPLDHSIAGTLGRLRHVILDLDGTLYLDEQLFDDSRPFLAALHGCRIGYTFITNNNVRSRGEYIAFMRDLGVDATVDSLYTSAHATIDYVRRHFPDICRPFVLGTEGLKDEFREAGFDVVDDSPDAVVIGFDRTLTYPRLSQAAYWLSLGLPYLATHPDRICPTRQRTVLPDCGALCALLESATGRQPDAIPGKPNPAMLAGIMQRNGVGPADVALIGDRLYTDMKMARLAGVLAVLTLTGETTLEQAANATVKPDLVVANLGELASLIVGSRKRSAQSTVEGRSAR